MVAADGLNFIEFIELLSDLLRPAFRLNVPCERLEQQCRRDFPVGPCRPDSAAAPLSSSIQARHEANLGDSCLSILSR